MRARVRNDDGASLIEYMLLVVLIAVIALIAIVFAGDEVSDLWSEAGSGLDNAGVSQVTVTTQPPVIRSNRPGS